MDFRFAGRDRLIWALPAAAILACAAIVVALANQGRTGSGRIFFGHHQYNFHLADTSRTISTGTAGFAFVAHLKRSPGTTKVRFEFQKYKGGTWRMVWTTSAVIPARSDTKLAKNYKLDFLARKGVTAPGRYRMVVFGRRAEWLAGGAFQLVRSQIPLPGGP